MHDKEKEILETEAKTKIETRRVALDKYKEVPTPCTATAIPFIYSFSGNCAASAPISTFMCLWAIYIFPGSVPPAEKADPSREYIIRSQTHECGNWDWGPDIPFLGIFASNFRHFFFAVCIRLLVNFDNCAKKFPYSWKSISHFSKFYSEEWIIEFWWT